MVQLFFSVDGCVGLAGWMGWVVPDGWSELGWLGVGSDGWLSELGWLGWVVPAAQEF